MQYVIDGINDLSVNKSILYNAKDLKEFKEKLKCYEKILEKSGKPKIYEDKSKYTIGKESACHKEVSMQRKVHCFNCGAGGHTSNQCPNRNSGRKCYNCNNFGHISKDCPTGKIETVETPNKTRAKYPLTNFPCVKTFI